VPSHRASSGSVRCRFCGSENPVDAPPPAYTSAIGSPVGSAIGSSVGSSVGGVVDERPAEENAYQSPAGLRLADPITRPAQPWPQPGPPKTSGRPMSSGREVDVFQRRPNLGEVLTGDSESERLANAALVLAVVSFACSVTAPFAMWQVVRTKQAAEAENVPLPAKAMVAGAIAFFGMGSLMLTALGLLAAFGLRS
jgi:hypothetical protein